MKHSQPALVPFHIPVERYGLRPSPVALGGEHQLILEAQRVLERFGVPG